MQFLMDDRTSQPFLANQTIKITYPFSRPLIHLSTAKDWCSRLRFTLFHLVQHDDNFWPDVTNRKCSSPGIRIYSNLIDTMASIGTPFHPLIQQEWNFLSLSRIEKCTFPSESIRFQWIRWTRSERLSTPSWHEWNPSNMSEIILSL